MFAEFCWIAAVKRAMERVRLLERPMTTSSKPPGNVEESSSMRTGFRWPFSIAGNRLSKRSKSS